MSRDIVLVHGTSGSGDAWAEFRTEFEHRGWTVHTPNLRHHDAAAPDQAVLVADVSLRDYADDVAALVNDLERPLLVGFSLGALVAQLVAARAPHRGLVCMSPSPGADIRAFSISAGVPFMRHFFQPRPWRKSLTLSWEAIRDYAANQQDEPTARAMYDDHRLAESGRAFSEMFFPFLDRNHAARVDYTAVTGPVLVIGGTRDRLVSNSICKQTAARYAGGQHVEIEGADHMLCGGRFLPMVLAEIDQWISDNHLDAV
jgi:pimeloyl-ACP methyl ester carboxylesterase